MQTVLNRVVKINIYLLVFLLPVFFLPFSFEAFEYNKQYLLFFLVSLAFFAWIAKMVLVDKEIRFKRSPLDFLVLAFLFIVVLGAIFSVDKSSSLFGFYGRFSNSLVGLLSFGALYFLITNHIGVKSGIHQESGVKEPEKGSVINGPLLTIQGLAKAFLWSVSFVILMSYLSIFGVFAKIGFLPRVMQQRIFTPVGGSLEALAVFLSVFLVFLVGLMLNYHSKSKGKSFIHWLLLASILLLLLIIDLTAAWVIVLTSFALFVGFSLWKRIFRENVNKLFIPIFLIVVASACIPLQPQRAIFGQGGTISNLPKEQVLNQSVSWGVGSKALTDNAKNAFFGSGLGTFHYNFAKQKSVEFNQDRFWQIRFDRAGNYFAEIVGTIGILGVLSYLAIIGLFLMIFYFFLGVDGKSEPQFTNYGLPLLLAFFALLVGQFVYYQNTTLAFLFWLILAVSVVSWQKPIKEKIISFKNFPELSLVFSTVMIILGLGFLAMYFFAANFYLADANYAKAQRMFVGPERTEILEKAVAKNSNLPQYRIILSRIYLNEALDEMAKPQAEQDSAKLQIKVAKAIDEARIATSLEPNQVVNWETLGMIYREIRTVAAGATEWGVSSFEKAIELEPTNPVLYTELGKMYLVTNEIQKAKEKFDQAVELKSDYIDAQIQTSLILEREGNLAEAIEKMESLFVKYPLSVDVLFQLGRLYFNDNQTDDAITMFKRVTTLFPNHSNAHYSLGVAYSAQGQRQLAIQEFEKVLELNPGNIDVQQKLQELRR